MSPQTVPNVAPQPPSSLSTVSVADALGRYAREVTSTKRGAPQEQRRIKNLIALPLASKALDQLRGSDMAQYRDSRLTTVGPNTVRLELALLSNLFEIARREWGYEALQNPVKAIRKPRLPKGRSRRMTAHELERLRGQCSEKFWALITVAVETGMRRGELAKLRWADVDLQRRIATLEETKNGDRRLVPLSSRAIEALRSLEGRASSAEQRVFGLKTADAITQAFWKACRAAKIEGVRFHDLRHEAVSRLFDRGLSLPEVAAISGHRTWAMLRRYTHLSPEALAVKLG
jgi:integrase